MRTLHGVLDVNNDGVISYDDFMLLTENFATQGHLSPAEKEEFREIMKVCCSLTKHLLYFIKFHFYPSLGNLDQAVGRNHTVQPGNGGAVPGRHAPRGQRQGPPQEGAPIFAVPVQSGRQGPLRIDFAERVQAVLPLFGPHGGGCRRFVCRDRQERRRTGHVGRILEAGTGLLPHRTGGERFPAILGTTGGPLN